MGSLKKINDQIWHLFLKSTNFISDNVYIQIMIAAIFFVLIWSALNYFIHTKLNKQLIIFGPFSMLFSLSAGYMVERLPMIHPRMLRALSISSEVIAASNTYLSSFEKMANKVVNSTLDIASHLYYLNSKQRANWIAEPKMLYESTFQTFNEIRGGWIFPDVHLSSFGTLSLPFILCILVVIALVFLSYSDNKKKNVFLLLQSLFLIYTTTISNGAFICAMFIWVLQIIIVEFFRNVKDNSS